MKTPTEQKQSDVTIVRLRLALKDLFNVYLILIDFCDYIFLPFAAVRTSFIRINV